MSAVVGEKAPGFTLPTDRWEKKISRDDEGPLLFFPGDWSSVCTHADGYPKRTYFIDREGVASPARHRPEVEAVLEILDRAL